MELKMIIAGFGGQGVMVTGKLLGYTACANHKQAMFRSKGAAPLAVRLFCQRKKSDLLLLGKQMC